jgi:AraC-like DNA-binding protein
MTVVITNKQEHINNHLQTKLHLFKGRYRKAILKHILNGIRDYSKGFFESLETIATFVGCSIRTVQHTIKQAEQLEIIQVKPQYKKDQETNESRRSTNLIELLVFKPFELINGVISVITKTARKVESVIKEVVEKVKEAAKPTYNNQGNNKKVIRTELLPYWFNGEEKTEKADPSRVQALKERLAKYNKN